MRKSLIAGNASQGSGLKEGLSHRRLYEPGWVAKEGPIVNQRHGVLVLSERTGAHQQLRPGALVISPCDVYATAEALHQALTMPPEGRQERAERLCWLIEREDIATWLNRQLETVAELDL